MTYYSSYYILSPYDIEHHGILGMKWGVRRYQNKDGTLTEAGKKRYGSVENLESARAANRERLKTAGKVALGVAGAAASVGAGYLINKYAGAQVASLAKPAIDAGRRAVGDLVSKIRPSTSISDLGWKDAGWQDLRSIRDKISDRVSTGLNTKNIQPDSLSNYVVETKDGKITLRSPSSVEKAESFVRDKLSTGSRSTSDSGTPMSELLNKQTPLQKFGERFADKTKDSRSLQDRIGEGVSKALKVSSGSSTRSEGSPMFDDPRSEKQQLQDRLREIERVEEYQNRKK